MDGGKQRVCTRLERLASHLDGYLLALSPPGTQGQPQGAGAAGAASARPRRLFPTSSQRAHYEEHGFVVVDDAVDPALVPQLLAAVRRTRDRVHDGSLAHGFIHRTNTRTPTLPVPEPWGIRGLFSPVFNEPVFADYIGHSHLTRYVCGFTGCQTEQDLGLGSITAFVNPRDDDYTIGWHRDGGGTEGYGKPNHDVVAEREKWEADTWPDRSPGAPRTPEARKAVGFQLALLDSDAFEVIPGSHKRWRSAQEYEAMSHYKGGGLGPTFGLTKYSDLPDMLSVQLRAGQTIFWDGDLIHRGMMAPDRERATLHCSMGVQPKTSNFKPSPCDKRLLWMTHPDIKTGLPRAWQRTAWERWCERQQVAEDVLRWHEAPSVEQPQWDFAQ